MTSELLAKHFTYVLTGITILIFVGILSSIYFGVDVNILFARKESEEVEPVRVDDSVNYISPSAGMADNEEILELPGEVVENGQISAIQTEQVTYVQNKYTVKLGDTLRIISAQVYGDPEAYAPIMKANNLASPDVIEVGMELVIPR
jgi:nucleoid-associated protein YgaU